MLTGMMTSNAATAEFKDAGSIVNKAAVKAVTDLGIMSANKDGSFEPAGKLTRAEMCKIICLIFNGGEDIPEPYTDVAAFSDVGGHWGAKYILYCKNVGAVAGNGDGTFEPDANITATQAAKMLLITIGYNAEISEFTGADWAVNVAVRANQKKLFEALNINMSEAISRDNAAQLINSALNAVMVEYENVLYMDNGELRSTSRLKDNSKGETLLTTKLKK